MLLEIVAVLKGGALKEEMVRGGRNGGGQCGDRQRR